MTGSNENIFLNKCIKANLIPSMDLYSANSIALWVDLHSTYPVIINNYGTIFISDDKTKSYTYATERVESMCRLLLLKNTLSFL